MSGPQFHETGYGRAFFQQQLPELTKSIQKLSNSIENMNTSKTVKVKIPGGVLISRQMEDDAFLGMEIMFIDEEGKESRIALVENSNDHLHALTFTNIGEGLDGISSYWKK